MRRTIGALILLLLTACGAAVATGADGDTDVTRPTYPRPTYPERTTTTTEAGATTTQKPHGSSTTQASTTVLATTTTCPDCVPNTQGVTTTTIAATTTTTGGGGTTTTAASTTTTTTAGGTTTTVTLPPGVTTTLPATFSFSGASTVCRSEVPTIVIDFATPGFPSLAGQTGILTMSDINGNVVSTTPIVYQPGGHVELLYPGTVVNADGSIADVPGWNLTNAGLWVRDPSDEFLREGIQLSYTVNPTATAFITYPPESSACANPENPPTPPRPGVPTTTTPGLPRTN